MNLNSIKVAVLPRLFIFATIILFSQCSNLTEEGVCNYEVNIAGENIKACIEYREAGVFESGKSLENSNHCESQYNGTFSYGRTKCDNRDDGSFSKYFSCVYAGQSDLRFRKVIFPYTSNTAYLQIKASCKAEGLIFTEAEQFICEYTIDSKNLCFEAQEYVNYSFVPIVDNCEVRGGVSTSIEYGIKTIRCSTSGKWGKCTINSITDGNYRIVYSKSDFLLITDAQTDCANRTGSWSSL